MNILPTIYQNKTKNEQWKWAIYLQGKVSSINCAQGLWKLFLVKIIFKVLR